MSTLVKELLAAANEAEERAEDCLRDGHPEGYETSRSLAASLRRLARAHADTDPEQFAGRSTQEVADDLGVTPGRIRQLARALRVGIRVGRDWRFSGNDVAALRARVGQRKRNST